MTKKSISDSYVPTVIQECSFKGRLEKEIFDVEVHIMSGQEDFSFFRTTVYERLQVEDVPVPTIAFLCYSCISMASTKNLERLWIPEVKVHYPTAYFYVVGLKSDLEEVYPERAQIQSNIAELVEHHDVLGSIKCSSRLYSLFPNENIGGVEEVFSISIWSLLKALKKHTKFNFRKKHEKNNVSFPVELMKTSFNEVIFDNMPTNNVQLTTVEEEEVVPLPKRNNTFYDLPFDVKTLEGHFGTTVIRLNDTDTSNSETAQLHKIPQDELVNLSEDSLLGYINILELSIKNDVVDILYENILNESILNASELRETDNLVYFTESNTFRIDNQVILFLPEKYISLAEILNDGNAWYESYTACVAKQIVAGLNFLHSINIVHTLLNLDVVGLNNRGLVKIFGLYETARSIFSKQGDVVKLGRMILYSLASGKKRYFFYSDKFPTNPRGLGFTEHFIDFFDYCARYDGRKDIKELINYSFLSLASTKKELGFFCFKLNEEEQQMILAQNQNLIELEGKRVAEFLKTHNLDSDERYQTATVGVIRRMLQIDEDNMSEIVKRGFKNKDFYLADGLPDVITNELVITLSAMRFDPDYLAI